MLKKSGNQADNRDALLFHSTMLKMSLLYQRCECSIINCSVIARSNLTPLRFHKNASKSYFPRDLLVIVTDCDLKMSLLMLWSNLTQTHFWICSKVINARVIAQQGALRFHIECLESHCFHQRLLKSLLRM